MTSDRHHDPPLPVEDPDDDDDADELEYLIMSSQPQGGGGGLRGKQAFLLVGCTFLLILLMMIETPSFFLEGSVREKEAAMTTTAVLEAATASMANTTGTPLEQHAPQEEEGLERQDDDIEEEDNDDNQDDQQSLALPLQLARPFTKWNASSNIYDWCVPNTGEHLDQHERRGLFMIKIQKCASSTGAGVVERVADTLGRRLYGEGVRCSHRDHPHQHASYHDYVNRDKQKSFLWTMIRHPAKRALSKYFYSSVTGRYDPTADGMMRWMKKTHNVLLKYTAMQEYEPASKHSPDADGMVQLIKDVLDNYNFIGVVERMPETLVVFSLLARVPLADVIVFSAKQSGGGYAKGCSLVPSKWTTPEVDEYLSGGFVKQNHWDFVFYDAVNESLDRTIDLLGREMVQERVEEFNQLTQKNYDECYDTTIFPCPVPDNYTHSMQDFQKLVYGSCYYEDSGCGHKCTDVALREESERDLKEMLSRS